MDSMMLRVCSVVRETARFASWFVLGIVSVAPVVAQSDGKPGFDPTPLVIPQRGHAARRTITPMDLLTLRDPKGLSLSPDGRYVAFVVGQAVYERNSYRSAFYIVSTKPGAIARNLGSAGVPHWDDINQWVPEPPKWSPDSQLVAYRMQRNNHENVEVWGWNPQTQERKVLTHVTGDVESYEWFPGKLQLFLKVKRKDARVSANSVLYDGNFEPWESVPIAEAIRRTISPEYEYWVCDVRRKTERKAEAREIHAFVATAGSATLGAKEGKRILQGKVSPDGNSSVFRYMLTDLQESEFWQERLLVRTARGNQTMEITPNAFLVGEFWWSNDSNTVYYVDRRGDGHSPPLLAYSMTKGSTETIFASASSDYFTDFSFDSTRTQMASLRESNTTPPEIVLIDTKSQAVRRLVDLNPEFKTLTLSPASRIEGTNRYGDLWHAHLVKPVGYVAGKRYPLIVTTYRSGDYFLRGAPGDESPIQVYAAEGFTVLSFDVGRGKTLLQNDFQAKLLDWASPTASIEEAIRQLIDAGLVDANRVGITGFSHGEEIVGYAVTHSTLFRAAVGAAGYDPSFYYIGGNVWQHLFARWGLGGWPEGQVRQRWEELALSLRADRVCAPILEIASDSEYLSYLPRVVSLQELGKPVELHIYPNERHVRSQPRFKYEIYVRNVDWFKFWLNRDEDTSPSKIEQTTRWRQLRDRSEQNIQTGCPIRGGSRY